MLRHMGRCVQLYMPIISNNPVLLPETCLVPMLDQQGSVLRRIGVLAFPASDPYQSHPPPAQYVSVCLKTIHRRHPKKCIIKSICKPMQAKIYTSWTLLKQLAARDPATEADHCGHSKVSEQSKAAEALLPLAASTACEPQA